MSTGYSLHWGTDNTAQAPTPHDLDAVLDQIAAAGPQIVDVVPDDNDDLGLQIGVGHPARAVLLVFGVEGGYAYEPDLSTWLEPIDYDQGGQATTYVPARTRLTPATARRAVHHYLLTGAPPADLHLDPGE
ncbi:Imm1 family immunity protein [Micromonospora sp. NBC_01796]|uniref:Imm1 family immunity protein n=1 Tax=Micromonospora sp. NBC_01796 TaxID=2975987 RepID=UPI002DD7D5A0|nr:Imm1 family immunity protein [Micromonospora sp. NBC_01796]WSA83816.1 Imm1 family immunity protein [Micromonospora sp. NBC_01796]